MKHAKKEPFCHYSSQKTYKRFEYFFFFWILKFQKKNIMKYDGQHLVNFLDHTNMPNYH